MRIRAGLSDLQVFENKNLFRLVNFMGNLWTICGRAVSFLHVRRVVYIFFRRMHGEAGLRV